MRRARDRGQLIAGVPLAASFPCFGLPLFTTSSLTRAIADIDEYTGNIIGFSPLDDDLTSSRPLPEVFYAAGDKVPLIYFSTKSKVEAIDYGRRLEWATTIDLSAIPGAVALQIADLCLGADERKRARRRFGKELLVKNDGAAASFANSSATTLLWETLLSNAVSERAAREMLAARGRIYAYINDLGRVVVEVAGINLSDFPGFTEDSFASEVLDQTQDLIISASGEDTTVDPDRPPLMFEGPALRTYLNSRLGSDGRISAWSYQKAADVVNEMEFKYGDDLLGGFSRGAIDYLEYVALSNRQGQVSRAELVLAYLYGKRFAAAYERVHGFRGWANYLVTHAEEARPMFEKFIAESNPLGLGLSS